MTTIKRDEVFSFGPVSEDAGAQLARCLIAAGEEARGVLCADHHRGYSMPIGGVIASQTVVMPAAVGFDQACGNYAVRTNVRVSEIHGEIARIMDEIWSTISFGVGRKNNEPITDAPVLEAIAHSPVPEQRSLLDLARVQLGTVGSGNHYLDLFEDRADGTLWVGAHFGSRGFGHKTASGFLALAAGKSWGEKTDDSMDAPPSVIRLGTPLADAYLEAMTISGQYAYAGREWVVNRVLKILGAESTFGVHNHHNFAWREEHEGQSWMVVRKGATPAFPGQFGFVGGSMGDDAVILVGKDSPESRQSFYSTVHGAGRVMGRMEAAGKIDRKTGEVKRVGKVDWPAWQQRLRTQGVELRGGGADEAPQCYKRLDEVLAYHGETIEVVHRLRPIGVAMAGRETVDPYRD